MDSNSQRGAVVAGAMRGDVRQKISKLEADSRQLCHNLRNLEKNRAKLTNEAVVLAQELENPALRGDQTEEAIYTEPANCIRVLLDAKRVHQEKADSYHTGHKCYYEESSKNDCCTICTCSECGDCSETAGDIEEKDLAESLAHPAISAEEPEGHECCYICYKNSAAVSGYSEKNAAATVASEIVDDFKSTGSEEKGNFRPACSDRCEICRCDLDDRKSLVPEDNFPATLEGEERCRGGMDRMECKFWPPAIFGEARNERSRRVCEGCECNLCDLRNADGASPPCLTRQLSGILNDEDSVDELGISSGDAPAKLQQICKVEKLREVLEQLKNRNHALRKMLNDCDCLNQSYVESLAPEKGKSSRKNHEESPEARGIARSTSGLIATVKHLQVKCRTKDGMILALAEAFKKLASPDQTERILTKLANPCTEESPIRDMDRSQLWKYLRLENYERQTQPGDRVSVEGKAKSRGIFKTCLLVLFMILSQIFIHYGCPASSTLFDSSTKLFSRLKEFSDRSVTVIKDFSEEFNAEAMKRFTQASVFLLEYANFFSSHLTYLGALFGSLSFARTVWSLGKKFVVRNRVSRDCSLSARLREFLGSVKSFATRITCYAKSQYHFFSYLSCLALGFIASKVTRIAGKWPAIVWSIYDENLSVE